MTKYKQSGSNNAKWNMWDYLKYPSTVYQQVNSYFVIWKQLLVV